MSDGALGPGEVCQRYATEGYDFLCISDHYLGLYDYPIADTIPNRTDDWNFAKLQNARAAKSGADLFAANCSICHYPDRKDTKKGPGLVGLFKNPTLPKTGRSTNEKNVRQTLINGGEKMPPFKHLQDQEIKAIINYLKSL